MLAWRFHGTGLPLVLEDVDEPTAGIGEVLITVHAAGLCHTDVGVLDDAGWSRSFPRLPVTLGHEVAGTISAVGPDVHGWSVGDRVGVCPTTSAGTPGFSIDGGFAPRMRVATAALVALPPDVTMPQAAIGTDAGMTSFHAVSVAGRVGEGDRVGIVGLGGLGQIGARVAVLRGAEVHVVDIDPRVEALAAAIGATSFRTSVPDLAALRPDLVVDFAGTGRSTAEAIEVVRRGGRVVVVGMAALAATISTMTLIAREVELVGSNGGTPEDVRGVYDLMADGSLDPTITTIGFGDIADGIDRLRRGDVIGRLVADPRDGA